MSSGAVRWLVAIIVTMAAFAVSLWVCGALLLPLVLKSEADRWVVAAGLGVAVAALAALWGSSWAGRQAEVSSAERTGSISARWEYQRHRLDR